MLRLLTYLAAFLVAALPVHALDFGLKFLSHSYPMASRTSLTVDGDGFPFDREFRLDFYFSFYDPSMFGNIASVMTDDGQCVSIVGSRLDDGSFHLGMVVGDDLFLLDHPLSGTPDKAEHVELRLDKERACVTLSLNDNSIERPMDLNKTSDATFFFGQGLGDKQVEGAPFELRSIRVFTDQRNTHHWDFKYHHTDSTSVDDLGGRRVNVVNPHWLIDDHADWKMIYSAKLTDRIQTAFNPEKETILIAGDEMITEFNPISQTRREIPVSGGERVMAFSNHLVYDTAGHRLINYNLNRRTTAWLDSISRTWRSQPGAQHNDEANYSNHAVAVDGDTLYAFGGYGFYKFHNDLFEVDLRSGSVTERILDPELMPMTSSAAAVVDGILYIFGGLGNSSGRQELPARHSYALYAYDTDTWKGELIWELDSIQTDFIPTQSMYYDAKNDSFYVASTEGGGQMIRLSRTKPEWNVVSTPIETNMECYGLVFDLYRSADERRYYLVVDRRIDLANHELSIYTITAPFLDDKEIIDHKAPPAPANDAGSGRGGLLWWIIGGVAVAAAAVATVLAVRKRRGRAHAAEHSYPQEPQPSGAPSSPESVPASAPDSVDAPDSESDPAADADADMAEISRQLQLIAGERQQEAQALFDRNASAISLLGRFRVCDREGRDITDKFTTKLKSLLILLLLSCSKNENGIKYQLINEQIWDDKDEKSAQNNRNVTMRKLRLLLQEVGNVSINYDKGYFRIDTGDVTFDYGLLRERIARAESAEEVTPELVDEILELLLMGPLLPKTTYEWLDPYKAEFTDSAIGMLTRLLKYESGKDDRLAYRIAETIALHDALNEEALTAKCRILAKRKMTGAARNAYDQFCREYLRSMGEPYPRPFPDICRHDISITG